jgi:putative salt-induced outer membrane protein YdiY
MHVRALTGCVIAGFALPVAAGVLVLGNGDRISGELIGIYDQQVRWQSDLMGEVVVGQVDVRSIDASDHFRVRLDANRELSKCLLQSGNGEQWLNCEQGMVALNSWRLVERITARPLNAPDAWRNTGGVTLTGRDRGGNADERNLQVGARIEMRRGAYRHIGGAHYDRTSTDEVKTADSRKLTYQFDYFYSDKWFFNSNWLWEQNEFQSLQQRVLIGAGVGYQFYDTELIKLSFELGPALLLEDLDNDEDRESATLRGSTDLRIRLNRYGLEFFHRNQLLQSLEDGADWRIETDTGFEMPIIGRLKGQTLWEFDYNNRPAQDAGSFDRIWSFGLNYSW